MTPAGYVPSAIEVSAGETIRFSLVNADDVEHEFRLTTHHVLDEGGTSDHGHDEIAATVPPGGTEVIDMSFEHGGEFDVFACLLPGHTEVGHLEISG